MPCHAMDKNAKGFSYGFKQYTAALLLGSMVKTDQARSVISYTFVTLDKRPGRAAKSKPEGTHGVSYAVPQI